MSHPNHHLSEHADSSVTHVVENTLKNENETLLPRPLSLTDDEIIDIRKKLSRLTARRVMNAPDAEDIVQDTLLTMISKTPCAALKKCPLAWSMGILRNKVGNYYRKERRHSSYYAVKKPNDSDETHPHNLSLSPERELLRGELFEIITAAVERLPAPQRCAMKLLIAGLNPGEIAKRMSPEHYQAVINHLYRGRRKIAQELNRYGCGLNHPGGMHHMKRSGGGRYRKNEDGTARIFHGSASSARLK